MSLHEGNRLRRLHAENFNLSDRGTCNVMYPTLTLVLFPLEYRCIIFIITRRALFILAWQDLRVKVMTVEPDETCPLRLLQCLAILS